MDQDRIDDILKNLRIEQVNPGATTGSSNGWIKTHGEELISNSPINGQALATIIQATRIDYEIIMKKAQAAFLKFRMMPAPLRGKIIREIANALRVKKDDLGTLISIETGKIKSEGLGEVQEMIDIADFAVGLSRQLNGLTMHSERPMHRMYEQWHPLGIIGIITAFNFPAAVWSWNALIAAVCGDVNLFKPSSKTPLTAIAISHIIEPTVDKYGIDGVFNLIIGNRDEVGNPLLEDKRIPLISATGSVNMGRQVAMTVGSRLGRSLLELGGNNAIIITEDCNLSMAVHATLFSAVGTAGQRCTSTRRIIIHKSLKEKFLGSLVNAYKQLKIGNPLDENIHMGPLIDDNAKVDMKNSINIALQEGGCLIYGGEHIEVKQLENGSFVTPAIIEVENHYNIVQKETFAPILYIIEYDEFHEALALHNNVPQGLSSSIFTNSIQHQEQFLSVMGSDCGIANVNIGTSGAEIGGAFGGEKETGGGRESGSDAWKVYMRRQTNTINWGDQLPLAQGVKFKV